MSISNDSSSESQGGEDVFTQTPAVEAPAAPAEESSTASPAEENQEKSDASSDNADQAKEAEAPAYTPSYKVKSFGKEQEIDESLRPFIKDADSEKKIKDLYERALGTDEYRTRYQGLQTQVAKEYEPIVAAVNEVAKAYQAGDFDTMFEKMQIPEKKILEWVAEKIRISELPEHEKESYNRTRAAEKQAASLEAQVAQFSQERQAYAVSQREFELNQNLAKAEIKDASQIWDSIYGEGSFKSEVIRTGQMEFFQNKVDLGPEKAVEKTLSRLKPVLDRLGNAPQATTITTQGKKVAVIPNLSGRSGSPAKKTFKTLEEIKAHAETLPDR